MELTDRKKQILKVVVEDYIQTAEPVGSKAIAGQMGTAVSSATIRNELAELVELGYLEQPHTSAGRVPSPRGYRMYVNELMEQHRLSLDETERINRGLHLKMEELDRVIAAAGQMLSSFEGYPTYVAAAGKKQLRTRRFELLPVDDSNCILVMMMSDDRVKSQLLRLQLKVPGDKLPMLSNLLNSHFVAATPDEMNLRLMDVSEQIEPALFLLLSQIVAYATRVLEDSARREVQTLGASQILRLPEFQDVGKAHELMRFLAEGKENLPTTDEDGPMKILIGPENVSDALRDSSVVVASYDIGDNMRGIIGVVGPTRMDYATVAARLSCFAAGLTRLFDTNELPPKEEKRNE
ncbi:MAG: heat-inducible transcriptional repressor HrcA [Oscillospiraceae bacterium]